MDNGRVYYTPLRVHMKELVNEIIADAGAKGYVSTRCKSGPKHIPGSTLLDPLVLDHDPDYMFDPDRDMRQVCQAADCHFKTCWRCPGCAALDDCGPASGFYCMGKERNCMKVNHRKRCRTQAPAAEDDADDDDEDEC